jgi:glycosyltransferase involved in cell wall biosynthesis
MQNINENLHKSLLTVPEFVANYTKNESAWIGHIPFGAWLVKQLKPRNFVELGTHYGHSYFAICQAIQEAGLKTKCFAIDLWEGDEHARRYGNDVFETVENYNNEHYLSFSTLLKMTFDDALSHFDEGSIDFLHIDGLHTYEAVKHDYETWLPKLAPGAVILFHDTTVKENNFGVYRLWDELIQKYPYNLNFSHSHGLGIIQINHVGKATSLDWLSADDGVKKLINNYFSFVGQKEKARHELLRIQDIHVEQIHGYLREIDALNSAVDRQKKEINALTELAHERYGHIMGLYGSRSWRLTRPLRLMGRIARRVKRIFKGAVNSVGGSVSDPLMIINDRISYQKSEILNRFRIDPAKLANEKFNGNIKFSVLMPVFKAPILVLEKCIESVVNQTYQNWELIIVDDCSSSKKITSLLSKYQLCDQRIKVIELKQNVGISGATNIALDKASGDFIALLDNDDLLTYDALACMHEAIIENSSAEIFYSDECKIDSQDFPVEIFCKPDWSPVLMHNCMYIGHLGIYKSDLAKKVGGFRSEFDFSQDYDFALRCSEVASGVAHVEKVLYGWRMLSTSAAAGGKPGARASNVAALQDAANRRGYDAEAIALPTANRIKKIDRESLGLVSIIIPSDNEENIRNTIQSILINSEYKNTEIIVVTNSRIIDKFADDLVKEGVRFIKYDKPYNFSDKCNVGAAASTGKSLIFFNDDVRIISTDWIESILEYLAIDGVGIVGPKLLYENGTIQHAGMVTGVRRLVGTAFHCLNDETGAHYNFAQSAREVSIICGACLAIKKSNFDLVGGFDAIDFPINHSDIDLCFKLRDVGLSCVYTPHAKLTHIGHLSLSEFDQINKKKEFKKDKADILLLKKWPEYISRDPFFPKNMRELLYRDSQETYAVHLGLSSLKKNGFIGDVLIVSHDLSNSGAPKIVLDVAQTLVEEGYFVVVTSPVDGPMRSRLQELGIDVVIDELCVSESNNFYDFAKNFDLIIFNTITVWRPLIKLIEVTECIWYIHEAKHAENVSNEYPAVRELISNISHIWCGSELSKKYISILNQKIKVVDYGVDDIEIPVTQVSVHKEKKNIRVFGSYEPRKGQYELLNGLSALNEINPSLISNIEVEFYGRILDPEYYKKLHDIAASLNCVSLHGEVSYEEYLERLRGSQMIIVPSIDDTLPLVSLHALACKIPLLCTRETGTSQYLEDGVSGFLFENLDPHSMARTLMAVLGSGLDLSVIGLNGWRVYKEHFSMNAFKNRIIQEIRFVLSGLGK